MAPIAGWYLFVEGLSIALVGLRSKSADPSVRRLQYMALSLLVGGLTASIAGLVMAVQRLNWDAAFFIAFIFLTGASQIGQHLKKRTCKPDP